MGGGSFGSAFARGKGGLQIVGCYLYPQSSGDRCLQIGAVFEKGDKRSMGVVVGDFNFAHSNRDLFIVDQMDYGKMDEKGTLYLG